MEKEFDIISWFEELAENGYAPALINDDNGRWAVSCDGYQNVPIGKETQDIETTFFVEEKYWKDSIIEAVLYAKEEIDQMLNEEKEWKKE